MFQALGFLSDLSQTDDAHRILLEQPVRCSVAWLSDSCFHLVLMFYYFKVDLKFLNFFLIQRSNYRWRVPWHLWFQETIQEVLCIYEFTSHTKMAAICSRCFIAINKLTIQDFTIVRQPFLSHAPNVQDSYALKSFIFPPWSWFSKITISGTKLERKKWQEPHLAVWV